MKPLNLLDALSCKHAATLSTIPQSSTVAWQDDALVVMASYSTKDRFSQSEAAATLYIFSRRTVIV